MCVVSMEELEKSQSSPRAAPEYIPEGVREIRSLVPMHDGIFTNALLESLIGERDGPVRPRLSYRLFVGLAGLRAMGSGEIGFKRKGVPSVVCTSQRRKQTDWLLSDLGKLWGRLVVIVR